MLSRWAARAAEYPIKKKKAGFVTLHCFINVINDLKYEDMKTQLRKKINNSSTPYTMNKDCVEPLVIEEAIEDESVDGTISQTNTNISLCFFENGTCRNIEISTDEMGIENSTKKLADLKEKETLGRQCPICFKRFMRQEYFTHIRHSHLESYPHQCKFCKFMCQDLNQLRHHVKKKHQQKDVKTTSFINYKESIGEVSYDLSKNNNEDDILSDEDIHLIEDTRKSKRNIEKASFICPLCFCKLKTLPNLKKHIMQHSYKRLECFLCKFMSIFKGQMSSHYYQEHHSKKPQWKEVFLDIGGPNQLVKDVEPYLLEVKIKYGIRKPNKTSNLKRQYQCPHCDYISNFNSSYNRHLRIHGGKKDFKCGYCNYHAREAYVIHKHSTKMHLNQEVKIEKDIGYNVPYRYSKQSKIESTKKSDIKAKTKNMQYSFTSSTFSNDAISEKVETFISDEGPISNPDISKTDNVNVSLISRDNKQISDYEIEKSWDHSYYEKNKVTKVSYVYAEGTRESKEENIVSLKKEKEHSVNSSLEKNGNTNLQDMQLKRVKKIYESEKTFTNLDLQLIEESENIQISCQNNINVNKSRSEFENDARFLKVKQYPLATDKLEVRQERSIINKDLTRVGCVDVDFSDNLKDYINSNKIVQQQNDSISELPSIVLCEDTDFETEAVIILSIDREEVIDNRFKTKLPIIPGDNMKEINEILSTNNDSSIDTCNVVGNSLFSKQGWLECPKMTEIEKEIKDKSITIMEYENFKDSETYKKGDKKDNEFDVHENRLGNKRPKNLLIPPKLNNPYASDGMTQDMIGLDYQNRDYFNPDKIRNMMKIVGNGRLECSICNVTTTRRAFYKHAKKHFNIKPFQCGHCNYQSIEKSMIRVHNSRCHSGSQCVIIKLSPKTASKLSKDLELIKHKSNDFSDSLNLRKNMSGHNTENCVKNIPEENLNIEPRVLKNKSISASNQVGSFKCPVCGKELRYHLPTVRRHLYTHYNYKPFKCGLCHFTASAVGEIRGHHVTHRTTEEARIESSGAVMDPNLTKLLEDSFGYGHTIT